MAKGTLICIIAALVLSCGCIGGGTGTVADIGVSNSSQGAQENMSGSVANQTNALPNSTLAANATLNATPENETGNVSHPGQCAPVNEPSQAEYDTCASQSKAMVEIIDVWNCTTGYRCMNASERLAYDLSKIQAQGCQDIPDFVIDSLAGECGANYQELNATIEDGCIASIDCVPGFMVIESNGSAANESG